MFRDLFNSKSIIIASLIAVAIISIIIIPLIIIGSGESMSEMEKAANAHRNVFIIYIILLAFTVILSVFVWVTSNKYQDAIKADADVKIETAKTEAAKANENIAVLTRDAELLKTEAIKAKSEIAKANARGEEAKLETARLKLVLTKYRAPRNLTSDQRAKFVADLKEFSGTAFDISGSTNETLIFALDIADTLTKAGWDIRNWTGGGNVFNLPGRTFVAGNVATTGIHIQIFDPSISKARDALVDALKFAGFEMVQGTLEKVPLEYPDRNVMHINVGPKP